MKIAMLAAALCAVAVLLLFSNGSASVLITEHGIYENDDIQFTVDYTYGSGSPDQDGNMGFSRQVDVSITSKRGVSIFNETCFTFEGRPYLFNARNITEFFYEKGYRTFDGHELTDNSIIELTYQMRKEGNPRYIFTRTVTKKFRLVRLKDAPDNGLDGTILLQEIED